MKNQFHPKYQQKYFWIFALIFFVAFWASTASSYKKFQGRIPEIFLLVFWMKLIFHKEILKSTDLRNHKKNLKTTLPEVIVKFKKGVGS